MDISSVRRNVANIESGEWVGDIPEMGDLRLKVRGIGSTTYQAIVARLSRAAPKEDRNRDNSLKPAASIRIMGTAAHEALLIDWENLTEGGKAVKYNAAKALEWLTNPEFRHFLDVVIWCAQVVENGRADAAEDLEKN